MVQRGCASVVEDGERRMHVAALGVIWGLGARGLLLMRSLLEKLISRGVMCGMFQNKKLCVFTIG